MKGGRRMVNLKKSQWQWLVKARAAIFDDTSENFPLNETVKIVSKFYVMSKEASAQALIEREQKKIVSPGPQFGATEDEEYGDDEGAERGDGA